MMSSLLDDVMTFLHYDMQQAMKMTSIKNGFFYTPTPFVFILA